MKRGILAGNGGSQRAIRQLPYPMAMEILLIGDHFSADDMLRMGLINKVVPAGQPPEQWQPAMHGLQRTRDNRDLIYNLLYDEAGVRPRAPAPAVERIP